jgi:hypothetical protein
MIAPLVVRAKCIIIALHRISACAPTSPFIHNHLHPFFCTDQCLVCIGRQQKQFLKEQKQKIISANY